ncbi:MAG: hypothetical protein GY913_35495 [Proteobacteria bacterium]|nr:hypothetical protein [Pseudomonadota bacterium]
MDAAENPAEFCACEREVHALALELAAEVTRRALQRLSDDKLRRAAALAQVRSRASKRGIELRVARVRKTKVRTLSGQVVEVVTPYATARPRGKVPMKRRGSQGTGVYPVLDALGIKERSTPALRLLVSRAVCEANSVTSARELLQMSGVQLGHKTALRLTYDVCEEALRARRQALRRQKGADDHGAFAGRRVVAAIDGGRVQIRHRVAGRPRKGGRKRFETEWREPKVLTIYVLDEHGKRDRKVASVIDGTLGGADDAFALLLFHLRRLGVHKARDLTLVGDAAPWIWARAAGLRDDLGIASERFQEVVDYFHAVQRLSDYAKTRDTWSEAYRRDWLHTQKQRLKDGRIEEIAAVFHRLEKGNLEAKDKDLDYWVRHRDRLRFASFRRRGLPCGSGAVESSVRRVVNLRMKGASVTWTEAHAEGVLHLRAHAKSGRWSELENTVLSTTGWRPTARQPRQTA